MKSVEPVVMTAEVCILRHLFRYCLAAAIYGIFRDLGASMFAAIAFAFPPYACASIAFERWVEAQLRRTGD